MNSSSFTWLSERRFRAAGRLWLALLVLAAACLGQLWHSGSLRLQTNIYALLPANEYRAEVAAAYRRVNDEVNDRLFITLEAPDAATLEAATLQALNSATGSGLLTPAAVSDDGSLAATLYEHRATLLADEDRESLLRGDYQALIGQALVQLGNPLYTAGDQQLREDPLLLFPRYLLEHAALSGASGLEGGWPTRHDGARSTRLLIFVLRGRPYSMNYQEQLLPWVERLQAQGRAARVTVRATGTVLFAAAASREAQREISVISLGSSLGLFALIWLAFRSPRPLATEFASLVSGCLVAFLGTHLLFGEVHMMTLIFGASLIGVSVDYSMHFMCAQAAHPARAALLTVRSLLPGLLMGLLTTVAAYACMALTPFPGLMQIASFSALGLISSWLTGMLLLPRLRPLDTRHATAALQPMAALRSWAAHRLRWQLPLMLALPLLAALLAWQWRVDDDVRNLQSMDAGLRHDEQIIQGQFSARQSGQFLVVYGSDEASSAAREAVLLAQLRELVSRGQLSGFQALGQWLPTAEVQASTLQALQRLPDSVLREYSAASGIEYADLSAWRSGLRHAVPLQAAAVAAPQLQRWQIGRQIRLVTLSGIGDYRRVASLGVLPGVQFVDPVNELSATFSRYRIYGSWLVALATLLLAGILAWRYGCAAVPAMLGPVLLSILCTLLLLLACGVAINLFVIMALFLILGIGVDYSIFYRESYAHGASVVVGVSLCMLSTALGFGLLAISHTSVIHAFGLTVLFGVGSSFLFATLITSAQPDGESLQ